MKDIIVTKSLVKRYGPTTTVLDNVDLSIGHGEWVSIVGPSGSGKTTLLNMMGCLDRPTSGTVFVNGTDVTGLSASKLTRFRRDHIGWIFQQHHLVPHLTALENVMLAQYFHSIIDEAQAGNALDLVDLGHRKHHLPSQLSGGEQQRVCIARSLINEPKILLADEPTGNLDQKSGKTVLDLISDLHGSGHTIIMVTHSDRVATMAGRQISMIDGKIIEEQGRT